jgi:hypothetical protein
MILYIFYKISNLSEKLDPLKLISFLINEIKKLFELNLSNKLEKYNKYSLIFNGTELKNKEMLKNTNIVDGDTLLLFE